MFRRGLLLLLAIIGVGAPSHLSAQRVKRAVRVVVRNAPPGDSATAVALLRAALERDSTVTVVDLPTADDLITGRYPVVRYVVEVTYRNDGEGERLEVRTMDVETSVILQSDTVRYLGAERALRIPPVAIPSRPPNRPLVLTNADVCGSGRCAAAFY